MFLERMFKLGISNNEGLHDEVAIAVQSLKLLCLQWEKKAQGLRVFPGKQTYRDTISNSMCVFHLQTRTYEHNVLTQDLEEHKRKINNYGHTTYTNTGVLLMHVITMSTTKGKASTRDRKYIKVFLLIRCISINHPFPD